MFMFTYMQLRNTLLNQPTHYTKAFRWTFLIPKLAKREPVNILYRNFLLETFQKFVKLIYGISYQNMLRYRLTILNRNFE